MNQMDNKIEKISPKGTERERAHLVKCLLSKPGDLNLNSQNPHKKARLGSECLQSQCWGGGEADL